MRSYIVQDSTSVAANGNDSVLTNTRLENLPPNQLVQVAIYATGSATGLRATAFVGTQGGQPIEDSAVSAQNRIPIKPDDLLVSFTARGNQKLQLNAQNTTAGALTFFFRVEVTVLQ